MKKYLIVIFTLISFSFQGQSILVLPEGQDTLEIEPNPSAFMEIVSFDKGILIPRLTSEERNNIEAPAVGLLLFDLDQSTFCYFDGFDRVDLYGSETLECFGGESTESGP